MARESFRERSIVEAERNLVAQESRERAPWSAKTGLERQHALKVLLIAPANVVHTQRWTEALASRGVKLALLTQHDPGSWHAPRGVFLQMLPTTGERGYFLNSRAARRFVEEFDPDVINSHYASGYGTLGTLTFRRPHVVSVWGSDVYDFPSQSWIAGRLIRWVLRRADRVASTSQVMAEQVRRLCPDISTIDVTPFGVESDRFAPVPREQAAEGPLTIGTVKTLAHKYGIDLLIDAFAQLVADADPALDGVRERLTLLIVGDGPDRAKLEAQARGLGLGDRVVWPGKVEHAEVSGWLNKLDVYVAASRLDSESFGVAVIEASSVGVPVIVSDAGGLPEVVRGGETGIIVPRNDSDALARAMKRLALDASLRRTMGDAGRRMVKERFEWSACVDTMLECYRSALHSASRGAR